MNDPRLSLASQAALNAFAASQNNDESVRIWISVAMNTIEERLRGNSWLSDFKIVTFETKGKDDVEFVIPYQEAVILYNHCHRILRDNNPDEEEVIVLFHGLSWSGSESPPPLLTLFEEVAEQVSLDGEAITSVDFDHYPTRWDEFIDPATEKRDTMVKLTIKTAQGRSRIFQTWRSTFPATYNQFAESFGKRQFQKLSYAKILERAFAG